MKPSFPASLSDKATLTHLFFCLGEYLYYIRMLPKLSIKIVFPLCAGELRKSSGKVGEMTSGEMIICIEHSSRSVSFGS